MDLVDFDQSIYNSIVDQFNTFNKKLGMKSVSFIPISALRGDNVVDSSFEMTWYQGPTLISFLEDVKLTKMKENSNRFPVQYIIRPYNDTFHDYRGYAGRIASGKFSIGDEVTIFPSGLKSTITEIHTHESSYTTAIEGQSVSITLKDDVDISRGDMLVSGSALPNSSQDVEAMVCWFDPQNPMRPHAKYAIKHTTADARCIVKEIDFKLDINELEEIKLESQAIQMNEIAKVKLKTTKPLFFDAYGVNRITGSFVLIDESNNNTVGAGMII